MSKQYNIRWKPDDSRELRKAVKNFNAKISRLEKKNPQIKNTLPEKVSVRELKGLIDTRQDFKREINALKRFSKRGAEELVSAPNNQNDNTKITKWQKEEMNRRIPLINKKRADYKEKIGDIPVTSGGKPQGYTRGQLGMGSADEKALREAKPFQPSDTNADINRRYKSFRKQSQRYYFDRREKQMKDNYIKGISENFNPKDPEVKALIEKINDMDFNDFYKVFQAEDPTFEFASPKSGEDPSEAYKEHLINSWSDENIAYIKNSTKAG